MDETTDTALEPETKTESYNYWPCACSAHLQGGGAEGDTMLLTDFLHRQGGLDDLGRRLVVCEAWSFDQRSVLVSVSGWFQSHPYNVSGGFRSYWF
jgi:hypothetical protein